YTAGGIFSAKITTKNVKIRNKFPSRRTSESKMPPCRRQGGIFRRRVLEEGRLSSRPRGRVPFLPLPLPRYTLRPLPQGHTPRRRLLQRRLPLQSRRYRGYRRLSPAC